MDEIGLFPLQLVLLPTEQVPLHIFEDRYRELIGESLEHGTPFGIVYADDDGVREIGTLATVIEVTDRFDDGRLNVIVEGRERFRLLEVMEERSFLTGRIESVADQHDPSESVDVERALALVSRVAELTGGTVEQPDLSGSALSFVLAAHFEFSPELKQELLSESSERIRLLRLIELLGLAAESIERQQEISGRAQTNGKVHPPE